MISDLKDTNTHDKTRKGSGSIKTQTAIIIVCITFVFGFLSGVAFTIYKTDKRPALTENDGSGQEFQEMEKVLKEEAEKNSKSAEVWTRLGNFYFDHNQFNKAIQVYLKSVEFEPDNANVLTDLGVMYRRNKQPEKAIEAFNRAMKADPKHVTSQYNKGVVLLHDLNDPEGAIKVWENLLKINPLATAPNGKSLDELVDFYKKQLKK